MGIAIVTVGGARVDGISFGGVTWGEGGWDVGSCERFAMSLSGDLTLDEDRSVSLECLGGMNKGGVKAPSCLKVRLARLVLRQVL